MINEELRIEIEKLCDIFKEASISDAIDIAEHIGYFMLIRKLDKDDAMQEKDSSILGIEYKSIFDGKEQYLRWSKLKNANKEDVYDALSVKINTFISEISIKEQYSYLQHIKDINLRINKENIGSLQK